MGKQAHSIDGMILARIQSKGHGPVFTPRDFLDLGSREAVDQALSRHARDGAIRKLARGLYDFPKTDPVFGRLSASTEAVAKALADRDNIRVQPSGGYAANLLGLSEQVPMQALFLTDGPSRRVKLGKREIILKHTTPRNMATAGRKSGLVIQALRHLGQRHVDEQVIRILRRRLSKEDKAGLLKDIKHAPGWIGSIFRQLAGARK